uniref:Peptidase C14 caspase domain-containing protein n=1 Tax=Chlamydomonas euryale TaxID=1486919 RepID=A0A7R9VS35_9CHLO
MVGCSYPGTSAALKGCINDAQCMSYALKKHYRFTDQDIVMLRDDGQQRGPDFASTRASIYKGIQWLMTDLRPGTCLFFHFSGHGSQKRAIYGDEADGMDETICPSDFKSAGQIIDNDLNQRLVMPLPAGVVLHCVIDACHSGTAMDLNYTTEYNPRMRTFTWHGTPMGHKGTRGGTAVQFGACRDSQVAQDTSAMSGGTFTGAATYALIQALEHGGPRQTYSQLLGNMTATLHRATASSNANAAAYSGGGGLLGALLGGSSGPREPQTPVMSCDKPIDLNIPLMFPP